MPAAEVLRLLLAEADRPIRQRLMATVGVTVLGGLLAALAPLALKGLVDALAQTGAAGTPSTTGATGTTGAPIAPSTAPGSLLWLCAGAYLAALWAGRVLLELRPLLLGSAEQALQARLAQRFFAHALALPAEAHRDRPTGALAQTLIQGAAACQLVMTQLMQLLPIAVELATAMLVLSHLGQPALAAVFAVSVAAYAWVFRGGTAAVRQQGQEVARHTVSAHAALTDALLNAETLRCFDAAPVAQARYAAMNRSLVEAWQALHRHRAALGLAVATVFGASISAALLVAGQAVAQGALSLGGFVLVTVYMLQMVRPVEAIGGAVRDIGQAVAFASPALALLRQAPEDTHTSHPAKPPSRPSRAQDMAPGDGPQAGPAPGSPDLQLRQVCLSFRGRRVLEGLDLHVPPGTHLAIVGSSGVGKSSLARLLLRLIEPEAGEILVGGAAARGMAAAELRRLIGYVPQDATLLDDTIAANVALGRPGATHDEIEAACRHAGVHGFISTLPEAYGTRVGERGLQLSGGERQRIAIARVLLKQPAVFLFDEATSALDGATQASVLRDLARITRGRTAIFITHRLAAARWAQTIAVLAQGRIAEMGTHQALLALDGVYARLWQLQASPARPAWERRAARSRRHRASRQDARRPPA